MKHLEQKRAEYALDRIKERSEELQGDNKKRYLNRVKSLPATIIMCGLGQSMATLLSVGKGKNESPDQMLYDDVEDWLCNREGAFYREKNLIEAIVNNDRKKYVQAQAESLRVLGWLKKFATAYFSQEVKSDEITTV